MLLSHPLTEHTSVNGWRSSCAQTIFVRHCGKRSTQRLSSSFARASATSPDVIVVGGGAAGLTAAYFAASAGAQVTVLERSKVAGNKVLISGGTRCNVLPMHVDLNKDYFTESSRSALKAVFASWSLEQCKIWLESSDHIGIPLACELADSKYFPVSNSAKEVRDKILQACLKRGVKIRYNAGLERLQSQDDMGWQCSLADGKVLEAKRIVGCSKRRSVLPTPWNRWQRSQDHVKAWSRHAAHVPSPDTPQRTPPRRAAAGRSVIVQGGSCSNGQG
ncbi:TPA: hypothetical protein ACH3X3_006629 [Trebouxia sp. C0006]